MTLEDKENRLLQGAVLNLLIGVWQMYLAFTSVNEARHLIIAGIALTASLTCSIWLRKVK